MFVNQIRRFCKRRCIEENVYISILLSLLNNKITVYDNANKDLVDILCKEIVNQFRKEFVINKHDFDFIE